MSNFKAAYKEIFTPYRKLWLAHYLVPGIALLAGVDNLLFPYPESDLYITPILCFLGSITIIPITIKVKSIPNWRISVGLHTINLGIQAAAIRRQFKAKNYVISIEKTLQDAVVTPEEKYIKEKLIPK